ncbi:ABC transporter permease [Flavobacterium chuncheonense]|uniref:ABC transporter permease n=1 Tax=Flavobacterium chuncheonense TaxID=2026653 RepID=A0ABW5YM65_9FLAO
MNFPFYIAKRYAVSFSKNSAINIITAIASLGTIASAMALFVVLSVFSGLRDFSLSFTNATDPDLRLETASGKFFTLTEAHEQKLKKSPFILSASKIIEDRVLFYYNNKEQVAYIKGVDSLFQKTNTISQHLYVGNWLEPETNEVVVGAEISRKLGLGLFDFNNPLEVYTPKPGKGLIENIDDAFTISTLHPVGIYNINEDVDAKYVFCDFDLTKELFRLKDNQVTNIEIKLRANSSEEDAINEIQSIFGDSVTIKTKAQLNDALYKMLNTENIAVYLIFTLVIIIALFNIIGALIMMIIDKKSNLKTLYSLGTPFKSLQRIFLFQGCLLTITGGIFGLLLGIILIILQQELDLIMITPTLAYPVSFEFTNVALVILTISVLGYLASWLASRSISKKFLE